MTIHSIEYNDKIYKLSNPVITREGITLREWFSIASIVVKTDSEKELLEKIEQIAEEKNVLDVTLSESDLKYEKRINS